MRKIEKTYKQSERLFVFLFCLMLSVTAIASPVDRFRESPAIKASKAAVMILDLKTGETLASHNISTPMVPASIMKCVTTAGLLELTGPEYRFKTRVDYSGHIRDGVLTGDIVVTGSGDPSLNTGYEDAASPDICAEIADALKAKGVNRVEGTIKVDESLWSGPAVPPTWASEDLRHSYGTGSHGLNFEDNATGKTSVANPASVFRTRLNAELRRKGIIITDTENGDRNLHKLFVHESAPIDEIMRSCMMRSDNQYAEALLRTIAVNKKHKGSTAEGARLNSEYWSKRRVPMSGVNIVDGSGLSRTNRVTAQFMAGVLREMSGDPWYASFFPLAGQEGTLKNFLAGTPLDSYVAMKTGSMRGIQCYAGYKLDEDYVPTHVIVVMLNEMSNRSAARDAVARMLLDIFVPEDNSAGADEEATADSEADAGE